MSEVAVAELTFDATIPRQLVHKRAVEAVYLTDSKSVGYDEYVCAAILPRLGSPAARAASDRFHRYDLAMLMELFRQAVLLVTHRHLGVPTSWATLLSTMEIEVCDTTNTGPVLNPVEAIIEVDVTRNVGKRDRLIGGDFELTVTAEDEQIARGSASGTVAPPEKYKIARKATRDAFLARGGETSVEEIRPVDAEAVGLQPGTSVLVSELGGDGSDPGSLRCRVCVDQGDLYFYDHPIDHVPGIVSVEAIRQAAVMGACRAVPQCSPADALVRRFNATFDGFGEPDLALDVDLSLGSARREGEAATVPIKAAVSQGGGAVVDSELEIELRPSE